jgi:hypothetical protein
MPITVCGRGRPDYSSGRCATRIAGNSVRQIAGDAAPGLIGGRGGPQSHDMRHTALALILLLAACAAPGSVASSPYHAPNEVDIGHAGGGGGGGGGM